MPDVILTLSKRKRLSPNNLSLSNVMLRTVLPSVFFMSIFAIRILGVPYLRVPEMVEEVKFIVVVLLFIWDNTVD